MTVMIVGIPKKSEKKQIVEMQVWNMFHYRRQVFGHVPYPFSINPEPVSFDFLFVFIYRRP